MSKQSKNLRQVDIQTLSLEELPQHIKALSIQFRRADSRIKAAKQHINHNAKKLENGGRNAQHSTERIDQARRELENSEAEYVVCKNALTEAQARLEAAMETNCDRDSSPLSDIPNDDDEQEGNSSDGEHFAGLADLDGEGASEDDHGAGGSKMTTESEGRRQSSTSGTLSEGEGSLDATVDVPGEATTSISGQIEEKPSSPEKQQVIAGTFKEQTQEESTMSEVVERMEAEAPIEQNGHPQEKHGSPDVLHLETSTMKAPDMEKGNFVSTPALRYSMQHSQTSTAALLASIKGQSVSVPEPSFRKTGISQAIQEFQKILAQPVSEIIAQQDSQNSTLRLSNGKIMYRMSDNKNGHENNEDGEELKCKKTDETLTKDQGVLPDPVDATSSRGPIQTTRSENGKRKGRTDDSNASECTENEGSEAEGEVKAPKRKKLKSSGNKQKDDEGMFSAEKEAQIVKEVGTKRADETLAQYDRRRAGSNTVKKLAREQIDAFNRNPLLTILSPAVRKLCRSIAEFMPETGTSHRLLSLAVLTTTHGNIRCPFHAVNDHHVRFFDGDGGKGSKRAWAVTGVGMPPTKGGKKGKNIPPPEGYMHCGCDVETVLLDFYFWKSGTIRSASGEVEPWYETLHPRTRGLFYGDWKNKTGMDLADLWRLKQDPYSKMFVIEVTEADIIRSQLKCLQQKLLALTEGAKSVAKQQKRKMEEYVDLSSNEDSESKDQNRGGNIRVEEKAMREEQASSDRTLHPVAAALS